MNSEITQLISAVKTGDRRALARCISLVENESSGYTDILESLEINHHTPVIGITGPPGAGKSTLVNAIIRELAVDKKIAVLAVDPTSPFTQGSLLGDRLRMGEHYNNPSVYIRSLATRGALGGLSAKTIEITDILKAADFDYILIETVGVGQSEVEIAALADTTIVVFVPESGDEIQTIKSGIMEIADIFVINKADREGADRLMKSLKTTLHERKYSDWEVPVLKTMAVSGEGVPELLNKTRQHFAIPRQEKHFREILLNRAHRLAQSYLARKINRVDFKTQLESASQHDNFNIYRFLAQYFT